jgi:NAD(P)-dependent dehydrogenase (short-subunit alcohol dehydrogenase family)
MPSLFALAGKQAIVTGSTRGIGKAIAHRLAEHGANVVISSRKPEACAAVGREINALVGREATLSIPANIGIKAELKKLVDEARRQLGDIDILVCNAASNPYLGPMSGIEDEQFQKIVNNNILSSHWLAQLVAPRMRQRKSGSIIFISSIGGLRGSADLGTYAISKAADMQLARNLALEFGADNVRVNTIAPGLVKTDFARALWEDPERAARFIKSVPLKRLGEPDDIAGVAVLLASEAGRYVTGQTLVVDGGLLA